MYRSVLAAAASSVVVLGFAGTAAAAGGDYVFDGGSTAQRSQVRAALDASSFDWSAVPGQVTIHIARGLDSSATPGEISLDADLVDAGRFAWGTIQHEYAHQVDFFLLDAELRSRLAGQLGGASWWQTSAQLAHGQLTSERFASMLAWTYWQTSANAMRPSSARDESAALPPDQFRALLIATLGARAKPVEQVRALQRVWRDRPPDQRQVLLMS